MTLAQIRKPLLQFRKQIRKQLNHATVAPMGGPGNQLQKAFSVSCCVPEAMWSTWEQWLPRRVAWPNDDFGTQLRGIDMTKLKAIAHVHASLSLKPDYICLHNYGSTTHKQPKAVTVMPLDEIKGTCTFTLKVS